MLSGLTNEASILFGKLYILFKIYNMTGPGSYYLIYSIDNYDIELNKLAAAICNSVNSIYGS